MDCTRYTLVNKHWVIIGCWQNRKKIIFIIWTLIFELGDRDPNNTELVLNTQYFYARLHSLLRKRWQPRATHQIWKTKLCHHNWIMDSIHINSNHGINLLACNLHAFVVGHGRIYKTNVQPGPAVFW